jgi:hypothetical protein
VPHGGNWINRNSTADAIPKPLSSTTKLEDMPPAGIRLPKTFKLHYPDNIPTIVDKLKGSPEHLINQKIEEKKNLANERYGNRSTVGMLIKMSPCG